MILSSNGGWNPAYQLNSVGEQEELTCFKRDEVTTEAHYSCSINWKNQYYVLGGNNQKRQISRLSGSKLERIGNLAFDHKSGACSVMANQFIFMCFDESDSKNINDGIRRCRRSTGSGRGNLLGKFTEVALSSHHHRRIQISCSDSKSPSLLINLSL